MGTIRIKEAIDKTVKEGVEKIKEIFAPKKEGNAAPTQNDFAGIMPRFSAAESSEINENGYSCKLKQQNGKRSPFRAFPMNFFDKKRKRMESDRQ